MQCLYHSTVKVIPAFAHLGVPPLYAKLPLRAVLG